MHIVETSARTASASKYLQQLSKHFAHKVPVDWTPTESHVEFPYGRCRMTAQDDLLVIRCSTEDESNIALLKDVIDSHLARFAWKTPITLNWHDGTASPDA